MGYGLFFPHAVQHISLPTLNDGLNDKNTTTPTIKKAYIAANKVAPFIAT